MSTILVVGGAGYIGSHMVQRLSADGEEVLVLDDLSSGHRDAVGGAQLFQGDLGDRDLLEMIFSRRRIDLVMHFASYIQVGESVRDPGRYYRNNFASTLTLLEVMVRYEVRAFVFSSSAAIYGNVPPEPIPEDQPAAPLNPYGHSKRMVEVTLADFDTAYDLRSMCLRYFNAAGADPHARLGERHDPETHLIPLVLQVAAGRRAAVQVFGTDYPTPDGTCIRDYIHVCDLCDAHALAMRHLLGGGASRVYNLGNGSGFSVREVIDAAARVTGRPIAVEQAPRRPGDAAMLVADARRIREELNWTPRHPQLDTIVGHAWAWERQKGKAW